MDRLRDRFWLWGHQAKSHDKNGDNTKSRMTATEGALYLGMSRVFMVCFNDQPKPPFDREAKALDSMSEVVYSVVGDGSSSANIESFGHLDEIMRIAGLYPNTTGAIFDDFFGFGERERQYTPEVLKAMRERLHAKGLKLWVVVYDWNLGNPIAGHIAEFDCVTLWKMGEGLLDTLDETIRVVKDVHGAKRLHLGAYLYNFGGKRQFTAAEAEAILDAYAAKVRDGTAEGVILFSNVIGDHGYEAVERAKLWLKEHGDEPAVW
ncbi:MAG: hypothetical protein FWE70_06860 [Oscillospiraceae bacterium]|nr:hypothetical protein [Oscillospiraceae bacterium]